MPKATFELKKTVQANWTQIEDKELVKRYIWSANLLHGPER